MKKGFINKLSVGSSLAKMERSHETLPRNLSTNFHQLWKHFTVRTGETSETHNGALMDFPERVDILNWAVISRRISALIWVPFCPFIICEVQNNIYILGDVSSPIYIQTEAIEKDWRRKLSCTRGYFVHVRGFVTDLSNHTRKKKGKK